MSTKSKPENLSKMDTVWSVTIIHSIIVTKDKRTVILTRQDFLPGSTANGDLLFIFLSNILDFQRSLLSYNIKIWLEVQRLIVILSLAGPPRDPKI